MTWIAVALGGARGCTARHGVNQFVYGRWPGTIDVGVTLVRSILWVESEGSIRRTTMVLSRRDAFGSLAVLLELAASSAQAQSGPTAPPRPPVFKHDLPNVTMDGWEVTVSYVDYPPARVGQPHRHPGFVLAYVLEGSVIAKIVGEGVSDEERTYRTGEMFYEPPGATHQVSRNASSTEPARLLAMIFAKKGLPQTSPA